jgi:hypothetical protein
MGSPKFTSGELGSLVLDNSELMFSVDADVTTKVNGASFVPGASGLPLLDGVAKSFDRYILRRFEVFYYPSCGTTRDGAVVIGIDWDPAAKDDTLRVVQVLQPRIRTPVWEEGTMVLPPNRLMSRKFLLTAPGAGKATDPDYSAFLVRCAVTASDKKGAVGEVWVRYCVELSSPTTAAASGR